MKEQKKENKSIKKNKDKKAENYFDILRTPLVLVGGRTKERILRIQELIQQYKKQDKKVGVLASSETKEFYQEANLILVAGSKKDLRVVARNLSVIFREFDKKGLDIILAETFQAKEVDESDG